MNCKIEIFDKGDWGWCKTHDVGFSPKNWGIKKKQCPYSCKCESCKELNKLLNSIHWDDGRTANSKILKSINKIWTSWGINCG